MAGGEETGKNLAQYVVSWTHEELVDTARRFSTAAQEYRSIIADANAIPGKIEADISSVESELEPRGDYEHTRSSTKHAIKRLTKKLDTAAKKLETQAEGLLWLSDHMDEVQSAAAHTVSNIDTSGAGAPR